MSYPVRNEIHAYMFQTFGVGYGVITREMGHFIEFEPGGSGVKWAEGTPVQWYIDDIRGEEYPQVVLPDGHMFSTADGDIKVISKRRYYELYQDIHNFIIRKEK